MKNIGKAYAKKSKIPPNSSEIFPESLLLPSNFSGNFPESLLKIALL